MESIKTFEHPSYGLIEVSRCTSSHKHTLFGSPLSHSNTIRLRIHRGRLDRMLSHDWYYPKELICEVEMSPNQWAELVSSFGMSPGTPCTIKFDSTGNVESCPYLPSRELFDKEFKDSIQKTSSSITKAIEDCSALFDKKSITKADKEAILSQLNTIQRQLTDTIPFIQKSFNEKMDESVVQAKNELQAWMQNLKSITNNEEKEIESSIKLNIDDV